MSIIQGQVKADIDHWIAQYPEGQKKSAVMPGLMVIQNANDGHLTEALMDELADYLEIMPIEVYEVATFYSMYEHQPVGKHKICVCTNISCMLRGSEEVVEHLKKRLGVSDFGEISADGKFSIKEVECLGACVGAPMFQIGDHYHEHLTTEKIDAILASLE
jgi:NADH-quinone oxidoreductase subunit E